MTVSFVNDLSIDVIAFRLILAILFGGIVGYEREKNNRPAGFRTHILVCFGAAVVSMTQDQLRLNILALALESPQATAIIKTDLGRLGAQVISGIGFLGAGSIMRDRGLIGGMTTAAGIWATGCVGLAIGWGFYNIAFLSLFFIVLVVVSLKKLEVKVINKRSIREFKILFYSKEHYGVGILESYEAFKSKGAKILAINKNPAENEVIFKVRLKSNINMAEIMVKFSANTKISSIEEINERNSGERCE